MQSPFKYGDSQNEAPAEIAIKKVAIYASSILAVLIAINLFVAMIVQGRELPVGTVRMVALFLAQLFVYLSAGKISCKLSAFISVFSFYAAFILFPLLPVGSNPVQDLVLLFFIFHVISVIPYLVYRIIEDRYWIVSWLVLMFANFTYSFVHILERLENTDFGQLSYMFRAEPMLVFAHIGSLIFLQFVVYNYRKTNQKQQNEINEINETLSLNINTVNEQRDQLMEKNEEMIQLQEELKSTNEQLELKVRQRTKELEEQNRLLMQYGYMNSHILRSPIASLKGLYMVYKKTKKPDEIEEIHSHIEKTIEELESSSKSINKIISNEDPKRLKEIEDRVKQIYGDLN